MSDNDNTFPIFIYECDRGVINDLTGFNFYSKAGFAPDTVQLAITVEQVCILKDTISIRVQDLEAEISKSDFSELVR